MPDWCLQDLPLLVVPHPDSITHGPVAKEQIRQLATMAVDCGKIKRVKKLDTIFNKLAYLKCFDGITRRVSIRMLHGKNYCFFFVNIVKSLMKQILSEKFYNSTETNDFVLELESYEAVFSNASFDIDDFVQNLTQEVKKRKPALTGEIRSSFKNKTAMLNLDFVSFEYMRQTAKVLKENYGDKYKGDSYIFTCPLTKF